MGEQMKLLDQRLIDRRELKELTFHLIATGVIDTPTNCDIVFTLRYAQISLNKPGLSLAAYHLNLNDAS